MDIKKCTPVWWLLYQGGSVVASPDVTHLFRIICRHMGKRMHEVTMMDAMNAGWQIRRA